MAARYRRGSHAGEWPAAARTIDAVRRLPPADRPLAEPHPARLDRTRPDAGAILDRHAQALAAGDDGYLDPTTGLFVFTAGYLAARSTCCDTGCRHCPYLP